MDFKRIVMYSLIGFILSGVFFGTIIYFSVFYSGRDASNHIRTYEYHVGEFTTNLSNLRTYFKGDIVIETTDKRLIDVLDEKKAEIRDGVISVLITKTPQDVLDAEGQQKLRKEIMQTISKIVDSDKISNIYFIDYIIQ